MPDTPPPRPFQAALDQAKGQLAQARAQLVQNKAQRASAEANQLKSQLDVDKYTPLAKAEAASQQDLDNAVQTNLDIREAEQKLVAANAEIGVAKAAFFPSISLTGSGGGAFGRSNIFSSLMNSHTGIWSYGAQVTQPIFTGEVLKGNLRLAESVQRQEVIAYKQAIQLGFRDVSDALIGYQKYHQVRVRQQESAKDL